MALVLFVVNPPLCSVAVQLFQAVQLCSITVLQAYINSNINYFFKNSHNIQKSLDEG